MLSSASTYSSIITDARGTGSAAATLAAPLADNSSYFVAVRQNETEMSGSPVLACGPMQLAWGNHPRKKIVSDEGMQGMHESADDSGMSGHSASSSNAPMHMPDEMSVEPDTAGARNASGHDQASCATLVRTLTQLSGMSPLLIRMQTLMMADPVIHARVMADIEQKMRMMDDMRPQRITENGKRGKRTMARNPITGSKGSSAQRKFDQKLRERGIPTRRLLLPPEA